MAFTERGVAPADPTTDVGRMRTILGDVDYEEYEPPQEGFGLYQLFSDAQLQVFLDVAGGSVARAIALAYAQIGGSWASTGATIRTDDLTFSAKDSVGNWMTLAAYWRNIADAEDSAAVNDYFDLVSLRGGDCGPAHPEGSPWPACSCRGRCICW